MSGSSTNTLGKYQIIREIARSNDIVYEALDPTLNRRIALKELSIPPNLTGVQKRERIERFLREGRAAGKLTHPNIVTIYDVGKENDRFYIAMEYLEGQTLRDAMQVAGAMPIRDAVNYTLQICAALSYAHANGVIHRDIKPDNVQILPGGYAKLTDFGIARMMGESSITQDGQVFGTPSYMSPEQVAGKPLDTRSDIFSLGVMLYEMIAGKKPFTGDSVVTITYNIVNTNPTSPPGAPPYLVGVINKALAKNPDDRYVSVDDMAQDIREERCDSFGLLNAQPQQNNQWQDPFNSTAPDPFSSQPQSSHPQPVLTPYGTPMPSSGAGGPISAPNPFGQGAPIGAPVSIPPPTPPPPMLSAETRNFLGIFLITVALCGLVAFAIWSIRLAYTGFQMSSLIQQANTAFQKGDYVSLESLGKSMVDVSKTRPEGYYFQAVAQDHRNDRKAIDNYIYTIEYARVGQYVEKSSQRVGQLLIYEGDQMFLALNYSDARKDYELALKYGDTQAAADAQDRINRLPQGR